MLLERHSVELLLLLLACRREAHLNWVPAETVTVFARTTLDDQLQLRESAPCHTINPQSLDARPSV